VANLPRISIITPSFNQAAFIGETIASVLDQNYPNLEYIVIDGGSTDGSVDIIRKFEHRLAYWVSEKDRGQAHAINKGLERASGDIIAYLNSDDCYLEGTLMRVAEYLKTHPDVDLVHGRCRIVDENGNKLRERVGAINHYDEILDLWDVWWRKRNFVQPEVFWTRRIADKIGPFREDLFWVMDYEYWLRILGAGGRVGFIDAELACFRRHSNQKSTQPERTAEELLKVVRPYIFAGDHSITPSKRRELKGKWFYADFLIEAGRSLRQGENRWRRWLRLLWFSILHPHVIATRSFRKRLFRSLTLTKAG
jgi:glycosyltransferase involved in cell wall biosynthesis